MQRYNTLFLCVVESPPNCFIEVVVSTPPNRFDMGGGNTKMKYSTDRGVADDSDNGTREDQALNSSELPPGCYAVTFTSKGAWYGTCSTKKRWCSGQACRRRVSSIL